MGKRTGVCEWEEDPGGGKTMRKRQEWYKEGQEVTMDYRITGHTDETLSPEAMVTESARAHSYYFKYYYV